MSLLIHAFRSFVNDHCVEVFQYAAKHDYRKLMDEAGLVAVQDKYRAHQIPDILYNRPDLLSAWVRVSFVTVSKHLPSSCRFDTASVGRVYLMSATMNLVQSFTVVERRIANIGENPGMWLSPK